MIREYHNHTLQTNPRHREDEPQNIYSNKQEGGGLNACNTRSIFALDSVADKTQNIGFQTNTMCHHRETIESN